MPPLVTSSHIHYSPCHPFHPHTSSHTNTHTQTHPSIHTHKNTHTYSASVALLSAQPEAVGIEAATQIYSPHVDHGQRMMLLEAMAIAATDMHTHAHQLIGGGGRVGCNAGGGMLSARGGGGGGDHNGVVRAAHGGGGDTTTTTNSNTTTMNKSAPSKTLGTVRWRASRALDLQQQRREHAAALGVGAVTGMRRARCTAAVLQWTYALLSKAAEVCWLVLLCCCCVVGMCCYVSCCV